MPTVPSKETRIGLLASGANGGYRVAEYVLHEQTFRQSFMICGNQSNFLACDKNWFEPPRTGSNLARNLAVERALGV